MSDHAPDDLWNGLIDPEEHGLEPHLNAVHGQRLNDLMGMSREEQEALHKNHHGRPPEQVERIGYLCIQGYPKRICSGCTSACHEPVFAYSERTT